MTSPSQSCHTQTANGATIGWFTAACLLVSNIVGGGIFTTTGLLAREVGDPWLILGLWAIGGLFAVGGAMVYGELGSRLPHSGGDYVYLREAYGPMIAFLSGWTSFTIGFGAAVAASAISFSAYAFQIIPITDERGWWAKVLSLGLLWFVTFVHCRSLGAGGRLQRMITSTKVLAVGILIVGGLSAGATHWDFLTVNRTEKPFAIGSTATALVIITYCYLGWNVAGFIATELREPARTLPRIMIGGTLFVALIYVLLNVVYLTALSIEALAREPIVPVVEKAVTALWGPGSGRSVAVLLCFSIAGAVSAMTWAGPRVYWAMANDGAISSWLGKRDGLSGVPRRAIVFQSSWASFLILTGTFEQLIVYSGIVLALFMALTLSAIFPIRWKRIGDSGGYRLPWYPLLPMALVVIALGTVLATLVQRPTEAVYGAITVLGGVPMYYVCRTR